MGGLCCCRTRLGMVVLAQVVAMTLSMQLDVAALTDAWNADDYTGALAPYIEIHPFGGRPTPLIHTSIWLLICDENDRREQARLDMSAQIAGYKDLPAALEAIGQLVDTDPVQARALYFQVTR